MERIAKAVSITTTLANEMHQNLFDNKKSNLD
jgi:hypothetical protein